MKKYIPVFIGLLSLTSCNSVKPIPYLNNGQNWDKSIVVLGDWDGNPETPNTYLHWAPVNAGFDASGEVATRDDHRCGRLYQWGAGDAETNRIAKTRYYNEPQPALWFKGLDMEVVYNGGRWNNDQGPCPQGWRLPTSQELSCLFMGKLGGYGWTASGHYAGADSYTGAEYFGLNDDMVPGKGVFFPAAGHIQSSYGESFKYGEMGGYWSSDVIETNNGPIGNYARTMANAFIISNNECTIRPARHSFGYSVRCVHDVN